MKRPLVHILLLWAASAVSAPSFWSSQEIAEAPALIAATTASLAALFHVSHQGA